MASGKLDVIVVGDARLRAIEQRLERMEKVLLALAEDAGVEPAGPRCGHCGSDDVIEDTAFGEARRVACRACGKPTTLEEEAVSHG